MRLGQGLGLTYISIVSIVVPFLGFHQFYIIRTLNGNPKKELQWRLYSWYVCMYIYIYMYTDIKGLI